MQVDYKLLLEQEKGAKEFVSDVVYEFMTTNKESREIIKTIYSFYQIGMTVEQVVTWMKSMQRLSDD